MELPEYEHEWVVVSDGSGKTVTMRYLATVEYSGKTYFILSNTENEDTFEFLYNSVPYEFTYELSIICRGMNEATMIIEQVASRFNPIVNIDVYDATNLDEPTRIPVQLLDIGITPDEYEEISSNIVTISFGLSLKGNIYPPIKTIDRIKDFKIFISENKEDKQIKKSVLSYEVKDSELQNEKIFFPELGNTYPRIIEIIGSNITRSEQYDTLKNMGFITPYNKSTFSPLSTVTSLIQFTALGLTFAILLS